MIFRLTSAVVAALLLASPVAPQSSVDQAETRFVVLGHIRGDGGGGLNPRLAELLGKVKTLDPDFAVLTGDAIWGDFHGFPPDLARVAREWEELDAALESLGIPIYRVPGNHDIHDAGTRDVWHQRYGPLPQAVSVAGVRLLLLSSVGIPESDDPRGRGRFIRGVDLDPAQVRWLAEELARPSDDPTFAFLGHLLWWEGAEGRWWSEVHPLLVNAGVRAVFSGDYGPMKFSTTERDGLRYYQNSIETPVSLAMLQRNPASRVLSAQFDNFMEVIVGAEQVDFQVHVVAEVSSGEFTPDRWEAIEGKPQGSKGPRGEEPGPSLWMRLNDFLGSPRRLLFLSGMLVLAFGSGWWGGRRSRG